MAITDDFTRADSSSLGSNWTAFWGTGLKIVSNRAAPSAVGTDDHNRYTGSSFSSDHSVETTIATGLNGSTYYNLWVRSSGTDGSTKTGFHLYINENAYTVQRWSNNSVTHTYASNTFIVCVPGDTIKLSISGNTLVFRQNSTDKLTQDTSASSLSGGAPGIGFYDSNSPTQSYMESVTMTGEVAGPSGKPAYYYAQL